jgi:SAM-dependent methyltransferase
MAGYYDLLASLLTFGRERELRERLADLAQLAPGESVLDVGCGTGSLAVEAKRRVGATGVVFGVDASPEMIAQARRKADRTGAEIDFRIGRAESLPFPDASFDVVLSTLMMHHLPRALRDLLAAEIRRVLRPGGRVLTVDFEKAANGRGGLISRVHRHGGVPLRDIVDLLGRTGLRVTEMGSVGISDLRFALATKSSPDEARDVIALAERSLPPLPRPRWVLPACLIALVAVHLVILRGLWVFALGTVAAAAVVVVLVTHLGFAGGLTMILRRHGRRGRR